MPNCEELKLALKHYPEPHRWYANVAVNEHNRVTRVVS